jgi:hypothetical protein
MTKRQVLCECCSDSAVEFELAVDGLVKACDSCGVLGRVDIDGDEDGSYVKFWPLSEPEAVVQDQQVLVEAYLKNQEIIDRLMGQVQSLKAEAIRLDCVNRTLSTSLNRVVENFGNYERDIINKIGPQ